MVSLYGRHLAHENSWSMLVSDATPTRWSIRHMHRLPLFHGQFRAMLTDAEISELIAGLLATPGFSEGDGE